MEPHFSHGKQSAFTSSEQAEMQEILDKAVKQVKITPEQRKQIEGLTDGEPHEPLKTPALQKFGLPFKPGSAPKN